MASETPGGRNARRKKLPWKDDRSTDKIYASGDQSVITPSCADSTLKPGEVPQAGPTTLPKKDDRSADKYYKAEKLAPTAQQIARGQLPPAPALGLRSLAKAGQPNQVRRAINPRDPSGRLTVLDPAEVNGVIGEVVRLLNDGEDTLVVHIKNGDANLLRRTRTALELMVTREVLTEEQFRLVRFSYQPSAADTAVLDQHLGAPTPRGEVHVEEHTAPLDPLAFLSGAGDDLEDPVVDTSPIQATTVDTSADVPSPPPPMDPAAENEEDDDTFLDAPTPVRSGTSSPIPPPNSDMPNTVKPVPIHFDEPISLPTKAAVSEVMPGIGDAPKQLTPETRGVGAMEAMEGIGEAPKPKKPGKKEGRGAK